MKSIENPVAENGPTTPPNTGLKIRLAMVVGWGILTFLLAISLAIQPAQAQGVLGEPLPDGVTMTRSTKDGREALTFKVSKPHSLFRYYDRIGTSWDNSGGNCYKNRVWFEYYRADVYDDTVPIRQSHDYTLYQREEGSKVCLLIIFGDFRDGGGGTNPNGPFSFTQSQTPTDTDQDNTDDQPVITQKTISGTISYNRDLELPDGSKMKIELHDTSVQDTANQLIAEKTLAKLGNPPHKFKLNYDPEDIEDRNNYSLQVRVVDTDGNPLLVTNVAVDVITRNNPTDVDIDLIPTRHLTQPDNTEDQTDDSQQETEHQVEPPTQEAREPLPLQMKKSQRPTEGAQPRPEPETTDQTAPREATENTSQEPEAPAEQTIEPLAATNQPTPTTAVEEPDTSNPSVTGSQTDETKKTGSNLIWLGTYIVVVLTVGAISLLLINKKDS